ncbi:MAG: hypothetical protein NTW87_08830, partial [Planctomycetota bacterium]|nr:hypothetical protein [Planctomycetota bacterium]
MSAENEVPDYYCNDREFLLGVLEDRNEEWEKLREDAYDAARLDLDGVIQPSEEVQEFLRLRDREIIERAARRLLGLGERRKVMGVLEQQLSDIAQLGEWLGR